MKWHALKHRTALVWSGFRIIALLGQYLQVARYSWNNSSIHTQCITLYTDPHHSCICSILGIQHFSLVSFTCQVTRCQRRYKNNFQLLTRNHSPRSSVGRALDCSFRGPGIKSHRHPSFFFIKYLQVARYSFNNSSIHPTYFFFQSRQ